MKALACLLLGASLAVPASRAAAPDVRYEDGRVTADLRDVALADAVGAIAAKAGLELRGTPTPQTLTMRLDAVPLAEAMARLCEGQSVALTYDAGGALKEVRFVDPSAADPGRSAARDELPAAPDDGAPGAIAASERPVPVDGLLAEALGADRSTFLQIVGVALQVGDARLRLEALRAALHLLDTEPDLRAEVSRTFEGLSEAYLAEWLERIAGPDAEEIARNTARLSHWKALRRQAAAVRRLLRTGG
jgi:hypothetical protein